MNRKKYVCTLIGTICVICMFSSVGCYTSRLSDADKQWITEQIQTETKRIKAYNAELTRENEGLQANVESKTQEKKTLIAQNEGLQKSIPITKDDEPLPILIEQPPTILIGGVSVTELYKQIQNGRTPDRVLRVGNRLVLDDDAITYRAFIHTGVMTINGIRKQIIKFANQNEVISMIVLKNGTFYLAPNGCEITHGIITEGEIEIYHP